MGRLIRDIARRIGSYTESPQYVDSDDHMRVRVCEVDPDLEHGFRQYRAIGLDDYCAAEYWR